MEVTYGFGFLFLPFLFVFSGLAINIVVALFVYNDAKKYTDNPILWFFIVLFLPLFLGVILYLLLRSDFIGNGKQCPNCNQNIDTSFSYCPHCHFQLKKTCDNCEAFVEDSYHICPYCGHNLKVKCISCNRDIEKDYKVCPYCGVKQEEEVSY